MLAFRNFGFCEVTRFFWHEYHQKALRTSKKVLWTLLIFAFLIFDIGVFKKFAYEGYLQNFSSLSFLTFLVSANGHTKTNFRNFSSQHRITSKIFVNKMGKNQGSNTNAKAKKMFDKREIFETKNLKNQTRIYFQRKLP